MRFPELEPLLVKVAPLERSADASDIWESVSRAVSTATTPAMAQSACDKVITMCHPKAWGDRYVTGFDSIGGWNAFLGELSDIATVCGQRIFENHGKVGNC
ncbi:hypothetical protein [Usitatibacter rugosus]|uniref:hypothetical protein n=1 Tax=Usitatibacter rugosus TaxID=2732067 RepID=UPI001488431F|nr:hypothetical protein [Usitatibacter rugosus]